MLPSDSTMSIFYRLYWSRVYRFSEWFYKKNHMEQNPENRLSTGRALISLSNCKAYYCTIVFNYKRNNVQDHYHSERQGTLLNTQSVSRHNQSTFFNIFLHLRSIVRLNIGQKRFLLKLHTISLCLGKTRMLHPFHRAFFPQILLI